ncbi:helix-turn-helix domain-containing protein [Chryseobacterium paludis]|uniref:helix-turn-helix domain-containing protein n=1 Tax=Chryseobacterium paludis TaxID=2956784 RepID=UPI0021BFB8DA|nr:helix-turn-helix domain-containing protein [Chryseobacterium paludis]
MKKYPDHKRIYEDILNSEYPDKLAECSGILRKKTLSTLDIISLNVIIFGQKDRETSLVNQRLRAYSYEAIVDILEYQRKHNMTNSEIALHFKISRNSIAKWKKKYE